VTIIIVVFIVLTAAMLLSAWLLIRQFRDPPMTAERAKLNEIAAQADRDITAAMNSSAPKPEQLRSAVQLMEGIIRQVNELEQHYQRKVSASEIKPDRTLVAEIELVRTCMRDARAKLQTELNKDE